MIHELGLLFEVCESKKKLLNIWSVCLAQLICLVLSYYYNFSFSYSSIKGCFNVAAIFEFYLEGPSSIFGDTCCSWDCFVSDFYWKHIFIVFFLGDNLSFSNFAISNMLFLFNSYVLSFSLGAGPVPALLLPEIFASRIRAKAVALSLGMHWVSKFLKKCFRVFFFYFPVLQLSAAASASTAPRNEKLAFRNKSAIKRMHNVTMFR